MGDSATATPIRGGRPLLAAAIVAGVVAVSWAAVLIRLAEAPSLSIAFWRIAMAFVLMAPCLAWPARRRALARLRPAQWFRLAAAGLFLGIHFWSWISSLRYTSVAASVLLVTTNPIWVGLLSPWVLGVRLPARTWAGIVLATAGAAYVALGADLWAASAPLLGNALALVGALAASGYLMFGRAVRQELDILGYATVTLGMALLVLAAGMLATASPFGGFPPMDWVLFLALAVGPQIVGHNSLSWALRYVRADVVAVSLLFEPVGASLLAWWLLGEPLTSSVVFGGVVLMVGIAVAVVRPPRD